MGVDLLFTPNLLFMFICDDIKKLMLEKLVFNLRYNIGGLNVQKDSIR